MVSRFVGLLVTGQMSEQRSVCFEGHHDHHLPLLHAQPRDGEDVAVHHARHEVDFAQKLCHLRGPDARFLEEKRGGMWGGGLVSM